MNTRPLSLSGLRAAGLAALLLSVAACGSPPRAGGAPAGSEDPLVQTQWRLSSWTMPGGAARLLPKDTQSRPLTVAFTRDGGVSRASGFAGCNQFSANYVFAQGLLIVKAPVSTRMACATPELSRLEGDYLQALTRVSGSTFDPTGQRNLSLTTTSGDLLRFERM